MKRAAIYLRVIQSIKPRPTRNANCGRSPADADGAPNMRLRMSRVAPAYFSFRCPYDRANHLAS
jgi:hypothetical protein